MLNLHPFIPANRANTLYLTSARFQTGGEGHKNSYQWAVSYKALQDWFYPQKNAVAVSAALLNDMTENSYIQPADLSGDFRVGLKQTDPNFFRIYSFYFPGGAVLLRNLTLKVVFIRQSLQRIRHVVYSVRSRM